MTNTGEPSTQHIAIEYEQAFEYIRHLYDTRHSLFNFFVTVNGAFLTVIFQFVTDLDGRLVLAGLGLCYSVLMTLTARRSLLYLDNLLAISMEIEHALGLSLLAKAKISMPKGVDSNQYFRFFYYSSVVLWIFLFIYLLTLL